MRATPIRPPARPLYDGLSEEVRGQVDRMAERVAAGANWKVRKKTMLDLLLALEALAAMPAAARAAALGLPGGGPDGEPAAPGADAEAPAPAETLVLFYAGTILERLAEPAIASAEQAAMYSLSLHPEHGESVLDWMRADRRNAAALRRIMRGDRTFRTLQRTLDAAVSRIADAAPDA
ncbi:hypothetical protein [Azospirillum sp. ST 5-10]|uniref:hypothetical protein n=1 Tax=unclassified Azospirillum TaxID=2630922 RepID=UPI003F49EBA8